MTDALKYQMGSILYTVGDVLASSEKVIVHGCNCFCVMGAGIAAQIRKQFPAAWKADQDTIPGDNYKLGRYTFAVEHDKVIFNAYTQYGTNLPVNVDYSAVHNALFSICLDLKTIGYNGPVAMPRIGCGLAGGKWNVVAEILEDIHSSLGTHFHVYDFTPT